MPRAYKLTWQPGTAGRAGRWRKKYRGQVHHFSGGRGKTDREAYEAAILQWEKLKTTIDAAAPKPHQAEYECAIDQWERVLTWCRKNGDEQMADIAEAKLSLLRKRLSAQMPEPPRKADLFEGQFDLSIRHPKLHRAFLDLGGLVSSTSSAQPYKSLPGYGEFAAAAEKFAQAVSRPGHTGNPIVIPSGMDLSVADPLKVEQELWRDRLEVMDRSSVPPEKTTKGCVDKYIADKSAAAAAGELSAGRVYELKLYLTYFMDWLGHNTPVVEITGQTLLDFRLQLLGKLEAGDWSRKTVKARLSAVQSFVRWLWHIEAIPTLPRILDGKSNALKIGEQVPRIEVFSREEITVLLGEASERTKLYILLMLNCGMTQKDIADLQHAEVDWDAGRITRKRSKTGEFENVPEVNYILWPETFRLLKQEANPAGSDLALVNEHGGPLWFEEFNPEGKFRKNDNVKTAFDRLQRKTKIRKPLKSLKKTSASLLRGNERFASLESLFLGHAPQTMAHRHYARAPQHLLDQAIDWLGEEYGVK